MGASSGNPSWNFSKSRRMLSSLGSPWERKRKIRSDIVPSSFSHSFRPTNCYWCSFGAEFFLIRPQSRNGRRNHYLSFATGFLLFFCAGKFSAPESIRSMWDEYQNHGSAVSFRQSTMGTQSPAYGLSVWESRVSCAWRVSSYSAETALKCINCRDWNGHFFCLVFFFAARGMMILNPCAKPSVSSDYRWKSIKSDGGKVFSSASFQNPQFAQLVSQNFTIYPALN